MASKSVSYGVVALAVVTIAPAAVAETTEPSALETVMVTAQKREQNPIEVPIALTAYSGGFLKALGIQEFDKLSLYVPGFQVQNQAPDNPGFVVRGITSDSIDATVEPRVSVFQDGVSISRAPASYVELFDIARIEVAKGPQSTLFGRGSLIGGVNVLTNRASQEGFSAAAGLEAGDYNYHLIEGMVNLPVSDSVALRVAGRYKKRDGYADNLLGGRAFNGIETAALRGSLNWTPIEAFSADLIVNFERDGTTATPFKSNSIPPTDSNSGAVLGDTNPNSGATLAPVAGLADGKNLGMNRTIESISALTSYKMSNAFTLNTITAYRRFDVLEVLDVDGSSLSLIGAAASVGGDQFSHEFRLNYDEGGRITAFAGASYFYESGFTKLPVQYNEREMLAVLTGQLNRAAPAPNAFFDSPTYLQAYAPAYLKGLAAKYGYALDNATAAGIAANLQNHHWEEGATQSKTKSVDLYADVTFHATDSLEFNAGLRYSHDDKSSGCFAQDGDRSMLHSVLAALSLTGPARAGLLAVLAKPGASSLTVLPASVVPNFGFGVQPTSNNGDRYYKPYTDDGFTWRATARYALAPQSSLYATYARGRRPLQYAPTSAPVPDTAPVFGVVAAETVDSFEVGYKTMALDGTLRLDTALYYYSYDNFSTTIRNGTQLIAANAGKADSYGIEVAADWKVTDWASLFATYAYGHARFGGDSIYKGNLFRLTPDHKLSVGASLTQALFGGVFTLLPTYTWQSKMFFDDNNDIAALQTTNIMPDAAQDEVQKAYGLMNLKLSYQPDNAPWSISLFANNVLDQKFIKDAGNAGDTFGLPTFIAGEPRMIGASLSVKL
jgi:outer membrane receptor protein involved in Fe transport